MARAALRDDVYGEQAALTAEVVRAHSNGTDPAQRIDRWLSRNGDAVERCLQVLADIRTGGAADLARLSVALREIRNLIHSSASAVPADVPAKAQVSDR